MSGTGAKPLNEEEKNASDGVSFSDPTVECGNAAQNQGGNPGHLHMGASDAKAEEGSEKKIGELLVATGKLSSDDRSRPGPGKSTSDIQSRLIAVQERLLERKARLEGDEEKKKYARTQAAARAADSRPRGRGRKDRRVR